VKTLAKLTLGWFEGRGWTDTSLLYLLGRGSIQRLYGGRRSGRGHCLVPVPVPGAVFVLLWSGVVQGSEWWKKLAGFMSDSDHGCNTTWWPVHVVIGHVPGCLSLYFFPVDGWPCTIGDTRQLRHTPECGPYHWDCSVGHWLDFQGAPPEVPSQEPHCLVSSCCYILELGGPGEVTTDSDSDAQVLASTCFQYLPMEEVAGCLRFLYICYFN